MFIQTRRTWRLGVAACWLMSCLATHLATGQQLDPLPSWQTGPTKQRIITFVQAVANPTNQYYLPPEQRIAVFDNDGTLWTEQPIPQLEFAIDRVKSLAPQHPEWQNSQPFKAILENDKAQMARFTEQDWLRVIFTTHANLTTDQFAQVVREWIACAQEPRFGRRYTELVYQPMLELLAYLRANGFKLFIVSGGTTDFMRVWAPEVYGIPPEQIVGSSLKLKYEMRGGRPELVVLPGVDFIDDKAGKPVGIHKYIGRRPVLAVGNSDGDLQMLQWTALGSGLRLALIIHHTDAQREYAYDRGATQALQAAKRNGWLVVDMKADWRVVYPFEYQR